MSLVSSEEDTGTKRHTVGRHLGAEKSLVPISSRTVGYVITGDLIGDEDSNLTVVVLWIKSRCPTLPGKE